MVLAVFGRPCASSSSLYSLFFRKEPEAKNWARTLAAAAAACKLFQSQLSWGFLINECLSEFSILFDFARCKEKQVSVREESSVLLLLELRGEKIPLAALPCLLTP